MKIPVIILILSLFFVAVADATEYTVTPSKNVGKPPGTPFGDEIVRECQPIPAWFAVVMTIFPQLAIINLEIMLYIKTSAYLLYVKVKNANSRSEVKKENIYNLIKYNPGLHFREIQRKSGIGNGTLENQLKNLKKERKINTFNKNNRCHYFAKEQYYSVEELNIYTLMNNETMNKILIEAFTKSTITNKEIVEDLGISESSASDKLHYLKKAGILNSTKSGWYTQYELSIEYSGAIQNYLCRSNNENKTTSIQNNIIPQK